MGATLLFLATTWLAGQGAYGEKAPQPIATTSYPRQPMATISYPPYAAPPFPVERYPLPSVWRRLWVTTITCYGNIPTTLDGLGMPPGYYQPAWRWRPCAPNHIPGY